MIGTRGEKMLRLTAKHADHGTAGWRVATTGQPRSRRCGPMSTQPVPRLAVTRDLERTATVFVDPTDRAAQSSRGPVSGTRRDRRNAGGLRRRRDHPHPDRFQGHERPGPRTVRGGTEALDKL